MLETFAKEKVRKGGQVVQRMIEVATKSIYKKMSKFGFTLFPRSILSLFSPSLFLSISPCNIRQICEATRKCTIQAHVKVSREGQVSESRGELSEGESEGLLELRFLFVDDAVVVHARECRRETQLGTQPCACAGGGRGRGTSGGYGCGTQNGAVGMGRKGGSGRGLRCEGVRRKRVQDEGLEHNDLHAHHVAQAVAQRNACVLVFEAAPCVVGVVRVKRKAAKSAWEGAV